MSTQIDVKIKHKGQPHTEAITLMWLSTTPTRELTGSVGLVYNGGRNSFEEQIKEMSEEEAMREKEYGYYTVLTSEKLHEIIHFYESNIEELDKQYGNKNTQLMNFAGMLPSCETVEVYEKMKEDIEELENHLDSLREMIDDYVYLKNKWEFSVESVFESNKDYSSVFDEYELIYYIG